MVTTELSVEASGGKKLFARCSFFVEARTTVLPAAIVWNLGTWYLGLPSSSSHTLVGSIIGVGLANQFLAPAGTATSGVDWSQATDSACRC